MTFQGVIAEIPLGAEGLNGSKNHSLIPYTQLIKADGVSLTTGALSKEGGTTKYNSAAITGAPSIIGGHDWQAVLGTQRMIAVTSAGAILKDSGDGTFPVTLASGLTVSSVTPHFTDGGKETEAANRKLFICTEKNSVQVLSADGATTSAISSGNADWVGTAHPICGVIHEGRLWLFKGHRAYYSLTTDHEDFTSTGASSLAVYPGEGDKIVAAISFNGVIVVWKYPRGIYLINTADSDTTQWRVTRHTQVVGTLNPQSITQVDKDIIFLDATGNVHVLSATQEFGDVSASDLSEAAQMGEFIRTEFNQAQAMLARLSYYEHKSEVHIAIPSIGSTVNNRRMILDMRIPGRPRFRVSSRDTAVSLWIRRDGDDIPRLMYGDNAGFVREVDDDGLAHDSAGYTSEFQTAHTDFAWLDPILASKGKNGKFLELVMEPVGNWNITIDAVWDGEIKQTIQFNMGTTGASLGSFELGTDKLAGDSILNKRKRLLGGGRRLSLVGRNSGNGEGFSLSKFLVHFTVADERTDAPA